MNTELLQVYTQAAKKLQELYTINDLQIYLQQVRKDPYVKSLEKRFIYDILYHFPAYKLAAFDVMKEDPTLNDDKIFTILKKAFYSVFGKNTFNFA